MAEGPNLLYYGDNLDVLRQHVKDESVDLVYLDPPFNSSRDYNVLFADSTGEKSHAQIEAFTDSWHWDAVAQATYHHLVTEGPSALASAIGALHEFVGRNDVMAYLVMMAVRLQELYRVLKPTGSLYLHCDPTASHYLKIVLDTIFGPKNFRNEISWKRFSAKNDPHRFGRSHDVLLFYSRGEKFTWNAQYGPFEEDYVEENYRYIEKETGRRYRRDNLTANKPGGDVDYEWHGARPYKGRHWAYSRANMDTMLAEGRIEFRSTGMPVYKRYLDEQPGVPLQDIWTDIRLHSGSKERLGYATQKPLALLERIVAASSNEGDLVLDPFCGCGTTIAAAEKLGRRWIGIDITNLAIALIEYRLKDMFPSAKYEVRGEPADLDGARALALQNRYQFQWWALKLVKAKPVGEGKKGRDRGIDGLIHFIDDASDKPKTVIVQVKSGHVGPGMIRDLKGTVESQKADMGLFITLEKATSEMRIEAVQAGYYHSDGWGEDYPKIQIAGIEELLAGYKPNLPPVHHTFKKAPKAEAAQPEPKKLPGVG